MTPVSIDSDIIIVNNATLETAWQSVRAALIWDKQPTGAVPAYADIYKDVNAGGTASSTGFSGRNLYTSDRFITIARKDLVVPPLNAANGSGNVVRFKFYKMLRGYQQQFKGDSAAITDLSTGALYLVLFAGSSASYTVDVVADHRFRYYDL